MSKYELVIIVNALLSAEEKESVLKEVTDAVAKSGAEVINSQVWLEKQKFTFLMKKCTHGTYYLINFSGPTSAIEKLRKTLKLNEKVLRFLVTKS